MDEAGLGAPPGHGINVWWVCAAVLTPLAKKRELDALVAKVRATHFRAGVREVKAKHVPGKLRPDTTADAALADLAQVVRAVDGHVWVTGTRHGVNRLPGLESPQPKDIARDLLLSRLDGFLKTGAYAPGHLLLVWDLSHQQELHDFSHAIATYRGSWRREPLCERFAPALLGGLSHDWPGIQLADVFAHYAMHKAALARGTPQANPEKARAFDAHFEPLLQRTLGGKVVGWKIW